MSDYILFFKKKSHDELLRLFSSCYAKYWFAKLQAFFNQVFQSFC